MSDPITRLNAALAGRYLLERQLGEGGMATVYLAKDLRHERQVALKVLKPELAVVVGAERFLAEIKTTASLQHPHILPLFDSGEADSFLFYVMPHVEGETLQDWIDRQRQLPVDEAVALAKKFADALDYAHGRGVIHRDIKPANVLLSERGEPLIADFGIALAVGAANGHRLTETGLRLGTPHYMSPEQATGDQTVGTENPLPPTGDLNHPRYSPPDGAQVAYEKGNHIWVYDVGTGANSRLTSGWNYQSPWWSRDGEWVYYSGWTGTSARYDGFRRLADASQEEEQLYRHVDHDYPLAQSTGGTQILIETESPHRGRDLLLVTDSGENPVFSEYLRADWNETTGTISPDGAWVAYVSDESGQREVYLRGFPEGDGQRGISWGGGTQPVWAPDGSAIYYRDGIRVMRATLTTGAAPSAVLTETLFEAQWLDDAIGRHDWDIHPNGRSFVAVRGPTTKETEIGGIPIIPVRVVVNWFEELKQRMGR